MSDTVHKVAYYCLQVPDRPGEALRILLAFKEAAVNLLAFSVFPIGEGKSQIDLIPEHEESFRRAAARIQLPISDRKRAFLVHEGDRVGAVADTLAKLARQSINVVASQAASAGAGRCGMILWVAPADYDRASEALGF